MNLMKLKADFENWEKNFFAVPGFEHKNEDVHGRHHDHTAAPELPADKMLEVQEEIKSNIERIKTNVDQTLRQAKGTTSIVKTLIRNSTWVLSKGLLNQAQSIHTRPSRVGQQ